MRDRCSTAWFGVIATALLSLVPVDASAQAIPRLARYTGNVNFVATGGSLRAAENNVNPCSLNPTSSQMLSGIPAGATIRAAYLYWGGSGATVDANVTLNGTGVTASQTFTTTVTPLGAT